MAGFVDVQIKGSSTDGDLLNKIISEDEVLRNNLSLLEVTLRE
jgi:hypothetical protein